MTASRSVGLRMVEQREQRRIVVGRWGLAASAASGRSSRSRTIVGPEQLHLGEMPEQVGGRPVRARRHSGRRIGRPQTLREAGRLASGVFDVVDSGHVGDGTSRQNADILRRARVRGGTVLR